MYSEANAVGSIGSIGSYSVQNTVFGRTLKENHTKPHKRTDRLREVSPRHFNYLNLIKLNYYSKDQFSQYKD
jgi:hypothetical protein